MKYIDLTLKRLDKENDETTTCTLKEAIQNDNLIVLLGAPGSGKSTLLQEYHELKDESQLFTIKKFLRLQPEIAPNTRFIFLDGLDEYRSTSNDKAFVMTELGNRICQFTEDYTIVISCREMDWYGETDVAALNDEVNKEAALYVIQPLDANQQRELAAIFDVDDIDTFISKFSHLGFLDNPQMFKMLSQIYKDNISEFISTKTDLYLTFIKNAREINPSYIRNAINVLTADEILKYAGYLAFFYMFSDVETYDVGLIDEICNTEKGYPKDKLETITKTSLFSEGKFIHRTITEFALANFLAKYKLSGKTTSGISLPRIKSLFIKNDRIPTELRGTYAWLCSLTRNKELIAVDPYYQAIHGDNSLFDSELKKQVVLEVKNYSLKTNPYFYKFENSAQIDGFYDQELDDFLIDEFESAIKLDNHYVYFICDIISSSTCRLSDRMKKFIKKVILRSEIPAYYKRYLLDIFKDEPAFLVDVLDRIKDNKIEDEENRLADNLLHRLYPESVTPDKVADYLNLYHKQDAIGFCYYLIETVYDDKFNLVEEIHRNNYLEGRTPQLVLPDGLKSFINDYFLETLLKFEDGLTAREIFGIISHFRKYYDKYDKLEFESYRYAITDKLPLYEDKLQRLTNELFAIYIDDILSRKPQADSSLSFDYFYHYFYSYKTPTNISEVCLNQINHDRDTDTNKSLFWNALVNYPKGTADCEKVRKIAKEHGLEEDLNNFLNPPKPQWQIKNEERQKKQKEKERQTLKNNEKHFTSRKDEEILATFSELHFISNLVYIKRDNDDEKKYASSLTSATYERLKRLLKNAIFAKSLIDQALLNLNSLAKESPDARRNIDRMYYSSCCLNNWEDIPFQNNDFYKYLFINVLMQDKISGIIKSNLVEQVISVHPELAQTIMREYLELLFDEYIPDEASLFLEYIKKETNIEKLKSILSFFYSNKTKIQDELLYEFLKACNFSISIGDLEILETIVSNEKNHQTISALKVFAEGNKSAFNVNMAIAIHSLLFLGSKIESFTDLDSTRKVRLIDYMFSQFTTAKSIELHNGFQSSKDSCAGFLRDNALNILDSGELKMLQKARKGEDDIWAYRITHTISEKEQANTDSQYSLINIEKIKNFIFSDDISSLEDFFADVSDKLNKLKTEIEDNRDNEKDLFHNQNGSAKLEEACRDVILLRLKDKYGYDLVVTKEKYEANNRVDINIKYAANNDFEIQVECKRDSNSKLCEAIQTQLIEKYFSSGVQYGIYLIFYFGIKKDRDAMLKKVYESIPNNYRNKIKVVCIDLRK